MAPQVRTGWHGSQCGSCCCAPSRRVLRQRRCRSRSAAGTGSTRRRPQPTQRHRRRCKRGKQVLLCSDRSETISEVSSHRSAPAVGLSVFGLNLALRMHSFTCIQIALPYRSLPVFQAMACATSSKAPDQLANTRCSARRSARRRDTDSDRQPRPHPSSHGTDRSGTDALAHRARAPQLRHGAAGRCTACRPGAGASADHPGHHRLPRNMLRTHHLTRGGKPASTRKKPKIQWPRSLAVELSHAPGTCPGCTPARMA